MSYVELHARSAFSFLSGASFPEELVETAAQLGMSAMALCDRGGVYGAPRFFAAAKKQGVRAIIGSELPMEDRAVLPVLVENRTGYKNLCRLLTRVHLRALKGEGAVSWDELPEFAEGLVALTGEDILPKEIVERLLRTFGHEHLFIEMQRHQLRSETWKVHALRDLAEAYRLPVLATNGVLYAKPKARTVLDVFTCIRNHTHLDAAGKLLEINSNRHVRGADDMRRIFWDMPEAVDNTMRLAERLQFSLDNLGYEFPRYPVPSGECMDSFLRKQTYAGAKERYGELTPKVRAQLDHELALIQKLGFPGYFLIVWDIVNFCREKNIMIQGRGSAANSAVCYSLGITAVDPVGGNLLFERFLSEGRKGWPDIDLDLPSGDRREAVIQEVYQRYGRHGAAMTANVITYRGKSAAREIGKALNFSNDVLDRFSNLFASGDFPHTMDLQAQLQQAGLPREHPRAPAFIGLYQAIYGLPRHLGQHSGGMIICQGQLDSVVPLENASMPGRSVAQWDKEDCEDLGIVKVDLLGLGMMSVLQDAIELTRQRGHAVDLAKIPTDDPATFEMMQKADTIGVFQIESRAQMATLPRMKPKCFYDVVIEVAIIRPGPIQGNMVHPYLARRAGREEVDYIDPRLEPVLARTLGVPLFQEQMLKIAMVMADFSGDEAEELRRALSFHRSEERMRKVAVKLAARMAAKGVPSTSIDRIIQSISSFALYGFPESHAISFAILAYGSAYLKTHYAPEFYASLLNNQPMGFYSPATIVKDAKRHGLKMRPVCAMRSNWLCTIEPDSSVRLGFCMVRSVREEHARHMLAERPFTSLEDFKARTHFNKAELRTLAEIGALNCFAAHRRDALWRVEQTYYHNDLFCEKAPNKTQVPRTNIGNLEIGTSLELGAWNLELSPLQPMTALERLQSDFSGLDLTTGPHPMALIRPHLKNILRAADLPRAFHNQIVRVAGNVICRQRPGTAKGFVFISLEDETGISNAIVEPQLFERLRLVITQEPFLLITGCLQHVDDVISIKAHRIEGLQYENLVGSRSHDFH
ncbi:MAG TPA: error-prone DNA polymerase [Verrucomicrobiae bacterium]|nr:error-prone DNA polymerase [Verrucomicrobiae bacterium]